MKHKSEPNGCLYCRFARWQRTKNGRLHPSKEGRCTFEAKIIIPKSAELPWGKSTICGGFINRDTLVHVDCPTFQPINGEP